MIRRLLTLCTAILLLFGKARADEGMWLLTMLKNIKMAEMKNMGLNLTADDIYSINNASMKDGIVMLSGGMCTAELISPKGLALTNHHCAYDAIQSHSDTGDENYLENGFWAEDRSEELPIEGMTASILVRMEDVTEKVKKMIPDTLSPMEVQQMERRVFSQLEKEAVKEGQPYEAEVKSFYSGNEYYLFVYKTLKDVRLVGAPPSDIGKFGGDEDNWMWPRHTGDFSLLRVYAGKKNKPAPYSEKNKPFKPKHFFPVSLNGVEKGDFTFIMGFPGSTDRYLSSFGIEQALQIEYPARIAIRDKRLSIMEKHMEKSEKVDIAYASKHAQVSNYYKYFKGQTKGLNDLNVKEKKKELEKEFRAWVDKKKKRKKEYGGTIDSLRSSYEISRSVKKAEVYLQEAGFASETVRLGMDLLGLYRSLKQGDSAGVQNMIPGLKEKVKEHFKNYHKPVDKEVTQKLYAMYYNNVDSTLVPKFLVDYAKRNDGPKGFADSLFANSILDDEEKLLAFLENPSSKELENDMGFQATMGILNTYRGRVGRTMQLAEMKREAAKKRFIRGLRKMNPDKDYAPDANSTIRLTYGTVGGYDHPKDGLKYKYYTTLEGAVAKDDPDKRLFDVPEKLEELYEKKDYGRYAAENGKMRVCFIHNTDITGGNSGSPVFNGDGHLVGVAFDGNWEAMSGDIAFEPELQRTISVDIRYVLFVIDKFANADHLIDEMKIINKKEGKKG